MAPDAWIMLLFLVGLFLFLAVVTDAVAGLWKKTAGAGRFNGRQKSEGSAD